MVQGHKKWTGLEHLQDAGDIIIDMEREGRNGIEWAGLCGSFLLRKTNKCGKNNNYYDESFTEDSPAKFRFLF